MVPPSCPLVTIIGSTGTGKSQLAVDLARRYNGEVINGDAMQIYQGLPVITNKLSDHERQGVPHHLLGQVPLTQEPWTVETFVDQALAAIRDVQRRDRLPILVGGTHYYLQSLLFRHTLARTATTQENDPSIDQSDTCKWPILDASTSEMYHELQKVDPVMARRWHPNDRRKIRRSLEIWLQTGQRASDVYSEQERARAAAQDSTKSQTSTEGDILRFPTLFLWTHTHKDTLDARLSKRVDDMIERGLTAEASELERVRKERESAGSPVDTTRGIWASIGYKEFRDYMSASNSAKSIERLYQEAVEQTKGGTRRYAKRQVRWIRVKLLNALRQAHSMKHLFLLDSTDPPRWDGMVLYPASRYLESFLRGAALPDPAFESEAARSLFQSSQDSDLGQHRELWKAMTCEVCGVVAVTEGDWLKHAKGRPHQKAIKAKRNRGSSGMSTRGADTNFHPARSV